MKIGIGTVQFGLDYGVSNKEGKTPPEEVAKILDIASKSGIRVIDTAALYGSSEEVLGGALSAGHKMDIVTKTIRFNKNEITPGDAVALEAAFIVSLSRLRAKSVYGLLLHDANDLLAKNGQLLMEKMLDLKGRGLVKKIGVSVYTGEQIDRALESPLDLVQLPVSVFDQRLIFSGHLSRLKKAGVEVHGRSVFLQGLLLMEPSELPAFFAPVKERLESYHEFIGRQTVSPVHAAIGFVMGLDEVDTVVCGVNNHRQLLEILKARPLLPADFNRFAITDETMLNPVNWDQKK